MGIGDCMEDATAEDMSGERKLASAAMSIATSSVLNSPVGGMRMSSNACPWFEMTGDPRVEWRRLEEESLEKGSINSGLPGSFLLNGPGELLSGLNAGVEGRVATAEFAPELRLPLLVLRDSGPERLPSYGFAGLFFGVRSLRLSSRVLRLSEGTGNASVRSTELRTDQPLGGEASALPVADLLTPVLLWSSVIIMGRVVPDPTILPTESNIVKWTLKPVFSRWCRQ